jgi:hypothetical protein
VETLGKRRRERAQWAENFRIKCESLQALRYSELLLRGWGKDLISKYLGAPDAWEPNPMRKNGAPLKLYDCQRVLEVEQHPLVALGLKRNQLREEARLLAVRKEVSKENAYDTFRLNPSNPKLSSSLQARASHRQSK